MITQNMNMQNIREILANATRLGGKTPAQLNTIFENWNTAAQIADQLAPADLPDIADQIATATPKTLAKLIETAATQAVIADRAREIVMSTQGYITHMLVQELRGSAGDQLISSLRSTFDTAAAGIAACPFSPDTAMQPTRVIELGDEAVHALRTLPDHAAVLTTIYMRVVLPLAGHLQLLPEPVDCPNGARYVAMVIDPNHNANLAKAAQTYNSAAGTGEPGAGWHRLATSGFRLRLNTPAEATELIEQWNESVAEQQRNREAKAAEATAALREAVATR